MTLAEKRQQKYTYSDYQTWNDSEDWEIISGMAYAMAPSPNVKHQEAGSKLIGEFTQFLKGKPCKVFYELDVVLSNEDIVKPDILIVCDKEKITEKNIQGAPDLIVEILSPSTSKKDKTVKLELYKKSGVKEYWLVDILDETITVFLFENAKVKDTYIFSSDNDFIPVSIFNSELNIDIKYVFQE